MLSHRAPYTLSLIALLALPSLTFADPLDFTNFHTSTYAAAPQDPIIPNDPIHPFVTLQVLNDLSGLPAQPSDPTRTHDIQLSFLGAVIPTDPAVPGDPIHPALTLSTHAEILDVTPPGGSVILSAPGTHGYFTVSAPSDPILPNDPVRNAIHLTFSALFHDTSTPTDPLRELAQPTDLAFPTDPAVPSDPLVPNDPIFTLVPADPAFGGGGFSLQVYHALPGGTAASINGAIGGGSLVIHTTFNLALTPTDPALPIDPVHIANVAAAYGSVDFSFDLVFDNPANANAAGARDLFTITTTSEVETLDYALANVPEPGTLALLALGGLTLLRRRK